MAAFEVNKAQWESLPDVMRERVRSVLTEAGVIQAGDEIVLSDRVARAEVDSQRRQDHPDHPDHCVEACWLAAEMAYRTCVANGGVPRACEVAMDQIYSQCMKGCR